MLRQICLLVTCLFGLGLAEFASACDTPVYRYAMYRWQPAPYEFYLFYENECPAADAAVAQRLEAELEKEQPLVNFFFRRIDAASPEALRRVAPDVVKRWEKRDEPRGPWWLVLNPNGSPIVDGTLTTPQFEKMVHSPVRSRVNQLLAEGNACVFIVLGGVQRLDDHATDTNTRDDTSAAPRSLAGLRDDPTATQRAVAVVQQVMEGVQSGELLTRPAPAQASDDKEVATPPHRVAWVKVDRLDPEETWLVRSLLAVESDLYDYHEPMIFPVYGRARALPPFIGKGISSDLLVESIEFLAGACSCTA